MTAGLYKFDFYVRDWITGTRELSHAARAVYIDLLATMYDHGGAIRYDERWLCRLLGFRDMRQLGKPLRELIECGKITHAEGKLSNERVQREVEAAKTRADKSAEGGRAKVEKGTRSAPDADQMPTSSPPDTKLNGPVSGKINDIEGALSPSPSPSPSPKNSSTAPADNSSRRQYAFTGTVIRLTVADFETWRQTYHTIPDLGAELRSLDAWCAGKWAAGSRERKDWFHIVPSVLNKKHQKNLGQQADREKDPAAEYWREIEQGVIH